VIFASDLDNTLLYSFRKYGEYTPGKVYEQKDGKSLSFMPMEAHSIFTELQKKCTFIPVTTRNIEQYNRVSLHAKYAIVNNGGTILIDGNIDQEWEQQTRRDMAALGASSDSVRSYINLHANNLFRAPLRKSDEFVEYGVLKNPKLSPNDLDQLYGMDRVLVTVGWKLHVQGRKVYAVPSCITKQRALEYLSNKIELPILACAGDSNMDKKFVHMGSFSFVPAHGEIADSDVQVTPSSGPDACTEILNFVNTLIK
jgi:hydroxymethylpyrimidine pyrophosphatase-like HAD family hydrolase